MSTPVPIRNRALVLDALRRGPTLADAAKAVSLSVNELRHFSCSQGIGDAFLKVERDGKYFAHPGVVDMTGQVLGAGTIQILRRAPNANGDACWRIKWVPCGHHGIKVGTALRAAEKRGYVIPCPECKKTVGAFGGDL